MSKPVFAREQVMGSLNGVVLQILLEKFGPVVARLILKWLEKHLDAISGEPGNITNVSLHAMSADAGLNVDAVRGWIADLMVKYKVEILSFIAAEMSDLYDGTVEIVRGS